MTSSGLEGHFCFLTAISLEIIYDMFLFYLNQKAHVACNLLTVLSKLKDFLSSQAVT